MKNTFQFPSRKKMILIYKNKIMRNSFGIPVKLVEALSQLAISKVGEL